MSPRETAAQSISHCLPQWVGCGSGVADSDLLGHMPQHTPQLLFSRRLCVCDSLCANHCVRYAVCGFPSPDPCPRFPRLWHTGGPAWVAKEPRCIHGVERRSDVVGGPPQSVLYPCAIVRHTKRSRAAASGAGESDGGTWVGRYTLAAAHPLTSRREHSYGSNSIRSCAHASSRNHSRAPYTRSHSY